MPKRPYPVWAELRRNCCNTREVPTLAAVVRVHVPQAQPSDRIAAAARVPVKDLGGSETVDTLLLFRCGGIVHALLVVYAAEAQSNRPVRIADVGRGAFVVLIEDIVVVGTPASASFA